MLEMQNTMIYLYEYSFLYMTHRHSVQAHYNDRVRELDIHYDFLHSIHLDRGMKIHEGK